MSPALENLRKILTRLFQLGLVLLLAGLFALVVVRQVGGDREHRDRREDNGDRSKTGKQPPPDEAKRLIAELRDLFGVDETDTDSSLPGIRSEGGSGIIPLKVQRPEQKGEIPLDRLFKIARNMRRDIDFLADRTTEVQQAMAWIHADDRLHYLILLRPYDKVAARMMRRKGEELFVSFLAEDGKRMVPSSAPEQVPTWKLRIAALGGKASGWVFYGELPLEGKDGDEVESPKVGWIFSSELHARLKQLQHDRREKNTPVKDPFGLDIDVKLGKSSRSGGFEFSSR